MVIIVYSNRRCGVFAASASAQIVVLEDFEGSALTTSGFDNFSTAFPGATSPLNNSNGTAGYFFGPTPTVSGVPFLTASQGNAYSGLHSEGLGPQEVIVADLTAGAG